MERVLGVHCSNCGESLEFEEETFMDAMTITVRPCECQGTAIDYAFLQDEDEPYEVRVKARKSLEDEIFDEVFAE
jgi:hypothetical protein